MLAAIGDTVHELGLIRRLAYGMSVFRVRAHHASEHPEDAASLGATAASLIRSSERMSPAGVPPFYGALDEDTAIIEARHANPHSEALTLARFGSCACSAAAFCCFTARRRWALRWVARWAPRRRARRLTRPRRLRRSSRTCRPSRHCSWNQDAVALAGVESAWPRVCMHAFRLVSSSGVGMLGGARRRRITLKKGDYT